MSELNRTKTIQDNLRQIEALQAEIQSHCMCMRMEEFDDAILVMVPAGFAVDAIQVSKGNGKIWALQRMLECMERYWSAGGLYANCQTQ